jgi:pterin-4a-carbinolamine dehydratase
MRLTDLLVESTLKEQSGISIVDSMIDNFEESTVGSERLPVNIERSSWETVPDPQRLIKTYELGSIKKIKYFINELLAYQDKTHHHAKILINGNYVTIETYTHEVNTVTQQDINLSRFADEVYEDTRFFGK